MTDSTLKPCPVCGQDEGRVVISAGATQREKNIVMCFNESCRFSAHAHHWQSLSRTHWLSVKDGIDYSDGNVAIRQRSNGTRYYDICNQGVWAIGPEHGSNMVAHLDDSLPELPSE